MALIAFDNGEDQRQSAAFVDQTDHQASTTSADEVFESYRNWTRHYPSIANSGDSAVVKYTFANAKGMKVLNILNDGNFLLIPERFDLKQRPLEPSIGHKVNVEDVVINVLGFIPFGFLDVLWLIQRWRGQIVGVAVLIVLAGLAVSFRIKLAQAYMPTRNSSLLDLITNVTGAILGEIATCLAVKLKGVEGIRNALSISLGGKMI